MRQQSFDEMIEEQFKRFPMNWTYFAESEKDVFRRFLKKADGTLEEFISWWREDEWRQAHPPTRLEKIMLVWPQAFEKVTVSEYRQL